MWHTKKCLAFVEVIASTLSHPERQFQELKANREVYESSSTIQRKKADGRSKMFMFITLGLARMSLCMAVKVLTLTNSLHQKESSSHNDKCADTAFTAAASWVKQGGIKGWKLRTLKREQRSFTLFQSLAQMSWFDPLKINEATYHFITAF